MRSQECWHSLLSFLVRAGCVVTTGVVLSVPLLCGWVIVGLVVYVCVCVCVCAGDTLFCMHCAMLHSYKICLAATTRTV